MCYGHAAVRGWPGQPAAHSLLSEERQTRQSAKTRLTPLTPASGPSAVSNPNDGTDGYDTQRRTGYIRTALQHVSSLSLWSTCQYNLSYWLQLLSAVTLIAPFSAKTNLRLVVPFGIPQVVTL